jgi:hypothetical protein
MRKRERLHRLMVGVGFLYLEINFISQKKKQYTVDERDKSLLLLTTFFFLNIFHLGFAAPVCNRLLIFGAVSLQIRGVKINLKHFPRKYKFWLFVHI